MPPEVTTGSDNRKDQQQQQGAADRVALASGAGDATAAAAVGFLASLWGRDAARLLKHPNATAERLAWIAEEAPSKGRPGGWARRAVEEGWDPPEEWVYMSKPPSSQPPESETSWNDIPAAQQASLVETALDDDELKRLPKGHPRRVEAFVAVLRDRGYMHAAEQMERKQRALEHEAGRLSDQPKELVIELDLCADSSLSDDSELED